VPLVRRNIVANYVGQGWTAIMGLAFIPIYIDYLGVEAYGLIGVFALLQAWLMLLDMGMTPALSREMARFSGASLNAQSIRDLLRSIEIIWFYVAVLIALIIWCASGWLASNWLKVENLPIDMVGKAFSIMGVVISLRFIENIYRSGLIGLEKQVILNVVSIVMATMRSLGAVGVLAWISPTIDAFFVWQGIVSVVSVIIYAFILYQALPATPQSGRFSWPALLNVWRFAAGIMVVTFLSFLLMQTDKILLSRLLTLENFGYYALATVVANSLYMFAGPIDQALFPRLTALAAQENRTSLIATYHMGAQLITVFVGAPAIVLMMFADVILLLWTQDVALTQMAAPLLVILSLGTLFNCLMHMPYQLQLAHGWTSLTIYVNIVGVILLVPAIFWVAPRFGAVGVAWVWVVLNASYLLFAVHFMFRRLLRTEKWRWYRQDIIIPLIATAVTAGIARYATPNDAGVLAQAIFLLLASTLIFIVAALAAPLVRQKIHLYVINIAKPYFAMRK